ncbi:MAG: hypothetical protein M3Y65_06320 [Pseudomonadota bacterium]|nr:hypothetical protein [Pseudomonadota bacterium]
MNVEQFFNGAPKASASAPGRVNLPGQHTYPNQGYMLPVAMSRCTEVALPHSHDGHFCIALCRTVSAGPAAPATRAACHNQAAAGVIGRMLLPLQPVREQKENR